MPSGGDLPESALEQSFNIPCRKERWPESMPAAGQIVSRLKPPAVSPFWPNSAERQVPNSLARLRKSGDASPNERYQPGDRVGPASLPAKNTPPERRQALPIERSNAHDRMENTA